LTRSSRDAGETLVEVVIAIAIMGIAFVALLGAMLTAASLSGTHRLQADVQLELQSALEQLKVTPHIACAGNTAYPLPSGASAVVDYWNGVGFGPTCYEAQAPYLTTQRITVTVTSSDGRVSRSQTILKRA
jgi:Tfp pilus assembly protein PilV